MDESRFDRLTRGFAERRSRRTALGMLAGVLAVGLGEDAAARRHANRAKTCAPGACPTGQTCCAGACVNLQTDNANCGACGVDCAATNTMCVSSSCVCRTVICSGSGCCPSKKDVCDQNDECCPPKTCQDYPPGACGPQDNGCGGTIDCGCCPGTACACPAGRTICDGMRGPKVYCPGTSCLCVARAGAAGSVCYSGGACYRDMAICTTDADCAEQGYAGFRCVQTGECALACRRTACVAECAGRTPGPRPPQITVLASPH